MHATLEEVTKKPFGTQYTDHYAVAHYRDGAWSDFSIEPLEPFLIHPGAHVFHYASSCFEGLKAHRQKNGDVAIFRLDSHMQRFESSTQLLCLPFPGVDVAMNMVRDLVTASHDWVPEPPGSLYIRPTLIGSVANIGAAATPPTEVMMFVLLSPVGDYFAGGLKPLRILIDDEHMRTAPEFGMAKTGGNYASALHHIVKARNEYNVSQVLFAPGGDVQETGAANFFLLHENTIITKPLTGAFLHGVTRDSMLTIAKKLGYRVEERDLSVEEILEKAPNGEAVLSGTAAVLAPIGTFIYKGEEITVGDGGMGPMTTNLRKALVDIQTGAAPDDFGWCFEA